MENRGLCFGSFVRQVCADFVTTHLECVSDIVNCRNYNKKSESDSCIFRKPMCDMEENKAHHTEDYLSDNHKRAVLPKFTICLVYKISNKWIRDTIQTLIAIEKLDAVTTATPTNPVR